MERWAGKIAVVTGASSGIGLATVKDLVKAGVIVIGLARRVNKMKRLEDELQFRRGSFHSCECDISKLESIKAAFKWIEETFSKINILINNAGILKFSGILTEGNEEGLRELIEVNLLGNVYCTKEAYRLMRASYGEECHIININSILGHSIPSSLASLTYNLYPTSKHALKATTEVLKQELSNEKNIRISSISPGLVKTEIAHSAKHPCADRIMGSQTILHVEDVSRAILFVIGSPRHVTISELIITPTGQKY
ncbi:farnesol dehydrogenase-like [Episyrphus balteatus]|uniref:farnesol dehydrogenase-like n=1 Tax=Episyrphus balteatus TaxID=286459 RepID=UPI0024864CB7|nr:farnesol dehydrogenase-like [Episyrphus balteatus]